jgi:hypothetical protein
MQTNHRVSVRLAGGYPWTTNPGASFKRMPGEAI